MKERPILFSAPMVRALLAGTKTQTRRVVKPVGDDGGFVLMRDHRGWWPYRSDDGESPFHTVRRKGGDYLDETRHACPYGKPGDRLWVREAWRACVEANAVKPRDMDAAYRVWFEADAPHQPGFGKLRPSMFMPRWASRITLDVVGVRVERLQQISEADAKAEGITIPVGWQFWHADPHGSSLPGETPQWAYRNLWESINGPGSWHADPWVWVVEFRRV